MGAQGRNVWKNHIGDRAGFSLVELVVVIAVMAVLAGASVSLMGYLRYADTEKAVAAVTDRLESQRITAMSQGDVQYLYLYQLSDGYSMKVLAGSGGKLDSFNGALLDHSGVKVCGKGMEIRIGSSTGARIAGNAIARIAYTRSGVFSEDTNLFSGTETQAKLVFLGNNPRSICLVKGTGKVFEE